MANEKVWTEAQREAAAKVVAESKISKFTNGSGWSYRDHSIDLQCELTAKDAQLAEAVELLKRSERRIESHDPHFAHEIEKFIKRNTSPTESKETSSGTRTA